MATKTAATKSRSRNKGSSRSVRKSRTRNASEPRGTNRARKIAPADHGAAAEADAVGEMVELPTPVAEMKADHIRDERLPPVGTKIAKRDRHGEVRAECEVEQGGIRYAGALYKSLSAAASAAAKDLGLKAAVNGFTWWQLVPAKRPAVRPAERLRSIGQRYEESARNFLILGRDTESSPDVRAEVEKHAARLQTILAGL